MEHKKDCRSENSDNTGKNFSYGYLIALLAFVIPVIIMFADVLFKPEGRFLSYPGSDIAKEFVDWRHFGFEQLKQGNLALWNPHVFSGIPFFGSFQSALLYPPNFLYLLMPLTNAINAGIVLHILLTGLFMFLWAKNRGLKPQACFFAAILLMFSAPYFMHICAGHLSNLCAMAWVPLIFLCIDGIFDKRSLKWVLVGTAGISMMILAGHPQYVFYTAVAGAIYSALRLINQTQRTRIVLLLTAMVFWAALIVSVQLLTGLQESAYSVRGDEGRGFEFAGFFSFPPENLLTLIAPKFFGEIGNSSYWGRSYLWEMSVFFSVTGLVLAIYGQIYGNKSHKRFCMTLIIILFILALGAHTPLFKILYNFVPGFDKFRGNSKFIYQMTVFAVMLAAIGLNSLITTKSKPSMRWILALAVATVILFITAEIINYSAQNSGLNGVWYKCMKFVQSQGDKFKEAYFQHSLYDNVEFIKYAAAKAAQSLFISGCLIFILSGLFAARRRWSFAVYGIIALAFCELILFALGLRPTFELSDQKMPPGIKNEISSQSGDFRIFNMYDKNGAMMDGMYDIWGDDPGIIKRYAYFMAYTEDLTKTQKDFSHRFYSLVRLKYVARKDNGEYTLQTLKNPILPRLLLVRDFQVESERQAIFELINAPAFDPNKTVILESQPMYLPQPSTQQEIIKIVDESTDHLTIEVEINSPAILLITDAYHPNWKIKSLPGSSQSKYEIMPADYVLRAVPLEKGKHLFRMEYRPSVFIVGMWISIISLATFVCLCIRQLYLHKKYKLSCVKD
ncbi:MAG: hypothetical protein ABFD79_10525 [Phycisphaerales bacterium]